MMSKVLSVLLVSLGFIALTTFNITIFIGGSQLTEAEMFENLCKNMPIFSTCHPSVATFFWICGIVLFSGTWILYKIVCVYYVINFIKERRSDK